MGVFSKLALDRVNAAGCSACGDKRLAFRAYVDARIPMMAGEPTARLSWAYDGEAFCDGIFEITCKACKAELFSSTGFGGRSFLMLSSCSRSVLSRGGLSGMDASSS